MADSNEIKVPDIGGATDVDVIEVLVSKGDKINLEDPLITLESDKATMEIPSPKVGVVQSIEVKTGDKVSEGDVILMIAADENGDETRKNIEEKPAPSSPKQPEKQETQEEKTVKVPDIGGSKDVEVIEILVSEGDKIEKEAPLITLESDKATMEIPSSEVGTVKSIRLKVGDKVSEGDAILTLLSSADVSTKKNGRSKKEEKLEGENPKASEEEYKQPVAPSPENAPRSTESPGKVDKDAAKVAAGPAVRRLAREFGVDLTQVKGTSRKSRISKEDLQAHIKERMQKSSTSGFSLPAAPSIDFSKFGEVETKPLNKIKRLTGENVHRSWVTIPHVTQFDEADITDLEAFRKRELEKGKKEGYKLTILAFVCKVVSKALSVFPQFNSSLDAKGENLIYKHYCHIGVAVETPNGLVVPVIKNVDQLSIADIAKEMARLSNKARDKGLMPAEMSGGCFTISSLGGIGGTAFTPIVNSPEVAILGLSRSSIKPIYREGEFEPRLMLPLSLSYDHRVIDGAEAARFTQYIREGLSDLRKILL